jgi:hypothetical protein
MSGTQFGRMKPFRISSSPRIPVSVLFCLSIHVCHSFLIFLLSISTYFIPEAKESVADTQSSEAKEFVRDTDFQDAVSSKNLAELSDDESEAGSSQTELVDIINNVKLTVVDLVTNVSAYFQKIFSFSSAEHTPAANESAGAATIEKTIGASLMGLAVIVIMVVVLRRP